jgi:hypothetical protein
MQCKIEATEISILVLSQRIERDRKAMMKRTGSVFEFLSGRAGLGQRVLAAEGTGTLAKDVQECVFT